MFESFIWLFVIGGIGFVIALIGRKSIKNDSPERFLIGSFGLIGGLVFTLLGICVAGGAFS